MRDKKDLASIKKGHAKNYKIGQTMCRGILKLIGAKVDIKGEERLLNQGTCVYMGTHKSYLDIIIMAALIDEPLTFIGKAELKKVPLVRTWFNSAGGLAMERDDIRQSFQIILEAIEELKEGHSVAIFPEGTRAPGRDMGEFKSGSFRLATKANVPIIPIAMQDTFKLLEETRRARPAKVYVNIGQSIDIPNLSKEKKQTIAKDTENYMRELLDKAIK